MEERILTADIICQFKEHLILEERSENTIEKYIRDIRAFMLFLRGCPDVQTMRRFIFAL